LKIKDYPVIKFFISFLIGILLAIYTNFELTFWLTITSFVLTFLSFIIFKKFELITNILVIVSIALVGWFYFQLSFEHDSLSEKILDRALEKHVSVVGKVYKIESISNDKISFYFELDSIQHKGVSFNVDEQIQVVIFLPEESNFLWMYHTIVKIGNQILLTGIIQKPKDKLYYGEYSYRDYLKFKGIRYILYADHQDRCDLLKANKSIFNFPRYINDLRLKLSKQIEENFDSLSSSYIKALILGDRSDIPENIKNAFINSGVIHVLAVSGLHTGYIVLILMGFSGRFNVILRLIFIFLGLFIFTHIANLSPSVIRASIMSIVVLLSFIIQRSNNLLNSISIAGLIILLMNPLDILNPGFQLSFGAVASIAIIYPILKNNFLANNLKPFWKYFSDLMLISLSVSIGTFPFVVSYYEKFSLIALFANLLIIPLTGIILGGIILNIATINLLPSIVDIYKESLTFLIRLNFQIVDWFANFPIAYKTFYHFSIYHSLFYYALLILMLYILSREVKTVIRLITVLFVVFNFLYHYELFSTNPLKGKEDYFLFIETRDGLSFHSVVNQVSNQIIIFQNNSIDVITNNLKQTNKVLNRLGISKAEVVMSNKPIFLLSEFSSLMKPASKTFLTENNIWVMSNMELDKKGNNLVLLKNNLQLILQPFSVTNVFNYGDWLIVITAGYKEENLIKNLTNIEKLCVLNILSKRMIIKDINQLYEFDFNNTDKKLHIFEVKKSQIEEIPW